MPKQCCNHCAAPAGHPFRGAGFAGLRKVTGFGVFDAGFMCVCVCVLHSSPSQHWHVVVSQCLVGKSRFEVFQLFASCAVCVFGQS